MKKKIALLLAFVMMISLLPMNVFGAMTVTPNSVPVVPRSAALIYNGGDYEYAARYLRIYYDDFREFGTRIQSGATDMDADYVGAYKFTAMVTISNGANATHGWLKKDSDGGYSAVADANDDLISEGIFSGNPSATTTFAAILTRATSATAGGGNRIAQLTVYWQPELTYRGEYIDLLLPYQSRNHANAITVTIVDTRGSGILNLDTTTIATKQAATGNRLTIGYGDPISFANRLELDTITLSEAAPGSLPVRNGNNGYVVELELSRGFTWDTSSAGTTLASKWGNNPGVGSSRVPVSGFKDSNGRSIQIDSERTVMMAFTTSNISLVGDEIRVANDLVVVPDDNTKSGTEAKVTVNVYQVSQDPSGSNIYKLGDKVAAEKVITVGSYVEEEVAITGEAVGDIVTLQSGVMDWDYTDPDNNDYTIDFIVDDWHLTSAVTLKELTAGSWNATGTNDITFSFDEGVQVLGVYFDSDKMASGNARDDISLYYSGGKTRNREVDWNCLIREQSVSIRPLFTKTTGSELASVVVKFYLSVEPDYVNKYGSNEIWVTVVGSSRSGVGEDKVLVAFVEDSITVETNPITVSNNAQSVANEISNVALGEVTISENAVGAFEIDSRLTLRIEDSRFVTSSNLWLDSTKQPYVKNQSETALRISALRVDRDGSVYVNILNPSERGDEPGIIVFDGLIVSGYVVNGTTYNINVVGDSLAKNYQWDTSSNPKDGVPYDAYGIFSNGSYVYPLFDYSSTGTSSGSNSDDSTAPGTQEPAAPINKSFGENDNYITSKGDFLVGPIVKIVDADTVVNGAAGFTQTPTGYVMSSVIADLLGLETWYDNGKIYFSGNGVSIVLTDGSSTATVNGEFRPMFNSSGETVRAFVDQTNWRTYVPLKFFQECGLFPGLEVTWDGFALIVTR